MNNKYPILVFLILLNTVVLDVVSNIVIPPISDLPDLPPTVAVPQIKQEKLNIDIQYIDEQLRATVTGNYVLSTNKTVNTDILFPIPKNSKNIKINKISSLGFKKKYKHRPIELNYYPEDPNIAPVPFIKWNGEVNNNTKYNITYA